MQRGGQTKQEQVGTIKLITNKYTNRKFKFKFQNLHVTKKNAPYKFS